MKANTYREALAGPQEIGGSEPLHGPESFTITRELKALACAVEGPRGARAVLRGIHVQGSEAVATDGRILLRTRLESPTSGVTPNVAECIVQPDAIKPKDGIVTLSPEDGGTVYASRTQSGETKSELPTIVGRYPEWEKCIPTDPKVAAEFDLTQPVLEALLSAMKKAGTNGVRLSVVDHKEPIGVRLYEFREFDWSNDPRLSPVHGIIMPRGKKPALYCTAEERERIVKEAADAEAAAEAEAAR